MRKKIRKIYLILFKKRGFFQKLYGNFHKTFGNVVLAKSGVFRER